MGLIENHIQRVAVKTYPYDSFLSHRGGHYLVVGSLSLAAGVLTSGISLYSAIENGSNNALAALMAGGALAGLEGIREVYMGYVFRTASARLRLSAGLSNAFRNPKRGTL